MKRVTFAIIMTIATVSHSQEPLPADAPVMFQPAPGYVCVPELQRVNEAKAVTRCLATNESLTKGNIIVSTGGFVGIITGTVVLTAVITGLVIGFTKK